MCNVYLQITLQALHGLQPGTQGHLLLKTENGQYQLLRVGPAPTTGTPSGTAVTPNSIAGNAVVAAPSPGTTYRLASVPAVSRLNTQFTGPPLATIRKTVQVTHFYTCYKTRCSSCRNSLVCDFSLLEWCSIVDYVFYFNITRFDCIPLYKKFEIILYYRYSF